MPVSLLLFHTSFTLQEKLEYKAICLSFSIIYRNEQHRWCQILWLKYVSSESSCYYRLCVGCPFYRGADNVLMYLCFFLAQSVGGHTTLKTWKKIYFMSGIPSCYRIYTFLVGHWTEPSSISAVPGDNTITLCTTEYLEILSFLLPLLISSRRPIAKTIYLPSDVCGKEMKACAVSVHTWAL